jgi:hypothetical protein
MGVKSIKAPTFGGGTLLKYNRKEVGYFLMEVFQYGKNSLKK